MANGKWLVTGIAGFCGGFLAELLVTQGCRVFGVDVAVADAARRLGGTCELIQADLADADAVRRVVAAVEPDYIAHLAALTNPAAPLATLYAANVYGTVHLLDAVKATAPACTILIAGSERAVWADSAGREPDHGGAELPADHPLRRDQGNSRPSGRDVQCGRSAGHSHPHL